MVRFRDDVGVGCARRADGRNEIGFTTRQERARKMNSWTVDGNARSEPRNGLGNMDFRPCCIASRAGVVLATSVGSQRGTKIATVLHERKRVAEASRSN